jgi:tetratricopeptide (TPR) repeat protein
MNRNDFMNMIEKSGPSDRQMIGEVSELISIFPYFQSAYMLLLKGLQNTADVRFENQLRISAMHIANREVLYYFLQKKPVAVREYGMTAPAEATSENDKTDTQQVVIESARNSEELISEIEKNTRGELSADKPDDYSIFITSDSGDKDSDVSIVVINEESGEIEEKVVYMDPGFSAPQEDDLLELDSDHEKSAGSSGEQELPEPEKKAETYSAKQLQSDLIDKFIMANPKIEPSREKTNTPVIDISKPFVEEREGFLTETLARIYIKQGYYSRAIDIYERLSLKFPEKSSYFASLIEKVKELIKK